MKRILLVSISKKINILPKLISVKPADAKLIFIPTAADPYEDKWFIEDDRKKLYELGFRIIEVDIKKQTQETLGELLRDANILYIAGGNTFYLLEKVRESGLDKIICDLVDKGLLYVGSSAGAIIAGPNIEPISLLDDPAKARNLKSLNGLGLVDFVVLPHYGKEKYRDKYKNIMRNYLDKKYKLVPITDEQFIIIEGDNYQVKE